MLKFFRHLRASEAGISKQLLTESKPALPASRRTGRFSKYLLYAFGEIVLVVIGILIALQLNNYNEERKISLSMNNALSELKGNLTKDSTPIEATILEMEIDLKIQKELLHLLSQSKTLDSSLDKSLGKCMIVREVRITQNGYEKLKEFGLGNLKNKSLENTLIRYYDILYTAYQHEVEGDNYDFEKIWLPYVRKNFKDYEYGNLAVPKDYLQLSKDDELFIIMKTNIFKRENTVRQLRFMQETNHQLLAEIKHHINQ